MNERILDRRHIGDKIGLLLLLCAHWQVLGPGHSVLLHSERSDSLIGGAISLLVGGGAAP